MLEKKVMSKEGWKRVLEREYIYYNLDSVNGAVSLLYLKKLTSPCYKRYEGEDIIIADDEYYWMQIALDNENWWLTVMYDKNMKLIQYYFDITDKNIITSDGNSAFYDLYLDVIILSNGQTYLLDAEELKDALEKAEISQLQYEKAYKIANRIKNISQEERKKLDEFCYQELQKLINKKIGLNKKET